MFKNRLLLLITPFLLSVSSSAVVTSSKSLSTEELEKQLKTERLLQNQNTDELTDDKDKDSTVTSSSTLNKDKYEDIAILNYISRYNIENNKVAYTVEKKDKATFLADNVSVYKEQQRVLEEKLKAELNSQKEEEARTKTIYLSGYCTTRNAIEVEQVQGYGLLDCSFEDNDLNISETKLMAMFTPLTSRSVLVAQPIYLLDKGNKKLPVQSGVILTADRTSLNVANFVNDKKIKKLTGDILEQTGNIVLNQSMSYMQHLHESKKKEEVISDTTISGTSTTKTTNTEAPDATTYLIHSGIQLFSGLLKLGGLLVGEDKYPLFKAYEDSVYYVDMVIEINGNKNPNLNNQNLKKIDYKNKAYEQENKSISIGEDVPEQKLELPSSPLDLK